MTTKKTLEELNKQLFEIIDELQLRNKSMEHWIRIQKTFIEIMWNLIRDAERS